jgi:arabinose-5-phosphate isomerase
MNFIKIALDVIETEAQAITNLSQHIDESFNQALELMLNCSGKVVLTGIGKSGLIAKKIAATLSSTGTPAIFLHPTEALHGDFGMIQVSDVIIALSHSGATDELCRLLPAISQRQIPLIAITSQLTSPLAKQAKVTLTYGQANEACTLGLAPTTSTTLALVVGDALAIALLEAKKFNARDFANNHPGGSLGRQFIQSIELAHTHQDIPIVTENQSLLESLIEISSKKLGMTCVVDAQGDLVGILTDGDIRRSLINNNDIQHLNVSDIMTRNPKSIDAHMLASDAIALMKDAKITSLIISDDYRKPIGILHIHDLLKAGFTH